MTPKILTHLKVFIPRYNEYPLDKAQKWADKYYARARHISGHRRQAIRTQQAVKEKVINPLFKTFERMLNKNFVSRSGLTARDILNKMKESLDKKGGRKYLDKLEMAYRKTDGVPAKYIKDRLPLGAANYAQKMTFGIWRLTGPLDKTGKGALNIVLDWLTGVTATPKFLRRQDEVVAGSPELITTPARPGRFRMQLRSYLMHAFALICQSNYQAEVIKEQNDRVNQLMNKFIRKDFVPFTTAGAKRSPDDHRGGLSHLDFVLHPETAELFNSSRLNEIRNKINAFFLGNQAIPLPRSVVFDKVKPSNFIGHPLQPIHLDMHLDLQITKK